jgi:hypothetical protein
MLRVHLFQPKTPLILRVHLYELPCYLAPASSVIGGANLDAGLTRGVTTIIMTPAVKMTQPLK